MREAGGKCALQRKRLILHLKPVYGSAGLYHPVFLKELSSLVLREGVFL
jgi:hypothetical protein